MNSKDGMRAAINREQPNRVPTALWGRYYTLNDGTYLWSGFTDLGGARMGGGRRDARGVEWVGTIEIRERLTTPQIRGVAGRLLPH